MNFTKASLPLVALLLAASGFSGAVSAKPSDTPGVRAAQPRLLEQTGRMRWDGLAQTARAHWDTTGATARIVHWD